MTDTALQYASINWQDSKTPVNDAFADVYFSRADGRAETEHVFMQGCNLPDDWQNKAQYTIGETGFGTGLNFLHVWQNFLVTAPANTRLTFISVEQYPLHPSDLAHAHALFDAELHPYCTQLQACYPLPIAGWHILRFGRVTLLLGLGDATAMLSDFDASVDAWFLDGFSPAKNPAMWQMGLYQALAKHSHTGTKIASFTAAGHVRSGLESVGFTMSRAQGFAHKRHRIFGVFTALKSAHNIAARKPPTRVIIIGAGIAGTSVAHTLSENGIECILLDEAGAIASGASGNAAAVLYPQLARDNRTSAQFTHLGYAHTLRLLSALNTPQTPIDYARIGMFKSAKDEKEAARLAEVNTQLGYNADVVRTINAHEASEYLGQKIIAQGVWYPDGSWVNPRSLCHAFAAHANITLYPHKKVIALQHELNLWRVFCADNSITEADCVIVATAHDVLNLLPSIDWKMRKTAGQISFIPAAQIATPLRAIYCHRGYIIPQSNGHMIGATYDHDDMSCTVTLENHARNKRELETALPNFFSHADMSHWQGRSAIRATTFDRMPYVGEVASGLYISTGHGSRGLITAPLCAEILVAQIMGDTLPIARSLKASLHIARLHP